MALELPAGILESPWGSGAARIAESVFWEPQGNDVVFQGSVGVISLRVPRYSDHRLRSSNPSGCRWGKVLNSIAANTLPSFAPARLAKARSSVNPVNSGGDFRIQVGVC